MKKIILAFLLSSPVLAQTLHLGQPVDNTGNGPSGSSILGASTVTVTATTCNMTTASGCSTSANGINVKTLTFAGSPGGAVTVTAPIAPGHEICAANSTGQALTIGGGGGTTVSIPAGTGVSGTASICMVSPDGVNYVQVGSGGTLAGDVIGPSGSNTVVKVNGASIPVSIPLLGTNSSGQLVNGAGSISAALLTGAGMEIGGDSICSGTGATNVNTNAFAYLLRPAIGGFWNITCRPGDQLIDTTSVYSNTYTAPTSDGHYPLGIMEAGTNDVTSYGSSSNLETSWQLMYAAWIYNRGIRFANKQYPATSLTGWTVGGSWGADTTQGSLEPDYVSTTNGNTLAVAASCTASCVGVLTWPIWNGNGGTFTVSLDGTPVTVPYGGGGTTFYAAGFNGATITPTGGSTGSTFSKALVRIPMSSGSHTVTVTVTSATSGSNKVGVSYFSVIPVPSPTNPNAEAVSIQHRNDSDDALSGVYSGYISALVSTAQGDGINAFFADVRDALLNTNVPVGLYVASAGTTYNAPQWVAGGPNTVTYAESGTGLALVSGSPSPGEYSFSGGVYTLNSADSTTPLVFNYTTNCGANETLMFANCYGDYLHPNNLGHAVYASVILSSLNAVLVTGNNVPQVTYPTRNYLALNQFPSQMMTPSANALFALSGPGFYPGVLWQQFVNHVWFTTMTGAGGLTEVIPFIASPGWSVATYNTPGQPTNESQLSTLMSIQPNGTWTVNTAYNYINGQTQINSPGTLNHQQPLNVIQNAGYWPDIATVNLTNTNYNGGASIRWNGTGSGAQVWDMGVGNGGATTSYGDCGLPNQWRFGNFTSGTCIVAEHMDSTYVHQFNYGIVTGPVLFDALPAASAVPQWTQLTVKDCTTFTPGLTCGGGGSDPMIAISDGTSWSFH